MALFSRVLVAAGLLCFAGLGAAPAGGERAGNICNNATCAAYCQGYCDAVRVRCKKTQSGARECLARGYRSCMNGCGWEICKMQPGQRPAYQCRRHPDL